ncbi:hypothetical protein Tco_0676730 [Tanacetum coccineum]
MPPKSAPMTQAAIRRMIKESVDATIAAERARQANVRNDASGSGPVRGRDTAPAVRECTFAGFMKCNPAAFHGVEGAVELRRWFKKTESVFEISECAEGKKVKFAAATLEGPTLTWWKTKVATMGLETVNQMQVAIQLCKVQVVQSSVTSSGVKQAIGIVYQMEEIDINRNWRTLQLHGKDSGGLTEESVSTSQPLELREKEVSMKTKRFFNAIKKANDHSTQELEWSAKLNIDEFSSRASGRGYTQSDKFSDCTSDQKTELEKSRLNDKP